MDDFELAAEMAAPGWNDRSLDSVRRRVAARGDRVPEPLGEIQTAASSPDGRIPHDEPDARG
jgi:hypothetical protein